MKQNLLSTRAQSFLLCRCLVTVIAAIGINPLFVAAQSGALTPNSSHENQFKPIPKRIEQSDFAQAAVTSDKVRIDKLVYKASYNQQPAKDPMMSNELPWTYQLRNLNYEQFQSKMADVWGERLLGQALDENNSTLRIFLPEGNMAPEASMKFDRVNGILTYEGAPSRKSAWHKLMQALDRQDHPQSRFTAQVIDVGMCNENTVRLVSAQFRTQDQDEQDSIDIPREQALNIIASPQQEIGDILGNVTLEPIPETNSIVIRGPAEDVAKIRKFLDNLNKSGTGMAAEVQSFKLQYTDPATIIESITSLYEERFATVNGPVTIIATPTGLLAAGSKGALSAVESIVKGLEGLPDAPVKPVNEKLTLAEKGYQRFVLTHISAQQAERAVQALFGQAVNAATSQNRQVEPVQTQVDGKNNVLTVYANPERLRRAAELIKEMDVPIEPNQQTRVLKVFSIRNHRAGDFAILLQNVLTQGLQPNEGFNETQNLQNQNQNQIRQEQFSNQLQSNQPFTGFTNLRVQLNGQPSAPLNFFDVRMTSDAASNTIQVVAPEAAMPIIADLIEELDKLPDLKSEVKVFPIVFGDAQQIITTLEQIFGASQQGNQGNQSASLTDLPLQSPGSDGASLINIRFAVNERTNTIIASGSAGDLEFVEALIYRLDEKDVQDRQTAIYRLSNASVLEVSTAINNMLDQRQAIIDTNPITNSLTESARRNVIVVEEETSNSLIVNARPEYFAEIEHIVNALDRRPPMVKVKAMIVQVDLNQLENFGVEFGLQDSDIFGANLSDTIGTGFVGLDNPAGQLISDLGVGRASAAAGISGLLLSAGDDSLNFVLRFLKQKGCASVLFKPQVMTMENLEGRFRQGARIQRATGSTLTGVGNVQQQFVETPIGLQLGITPRVSPDGMIVMFVDVENSSLGLAADGTVIGVDANGNAIVSQPINETIVQTTVMSRSGQTVVLSGLIQEQKGQTINSVPFLGDLPVVGPIFQSVENTADRTEILIFLTPYIVDGEDDLSALNGDDFERMHWCNADVAEAYGDTSFTGAPYRENYPRIFHPDEDPRGLNPDFLGLDDPGAATSGAMNSSQRMEPVFSDDGWRNRDNRTLDDNASQADGRSSRMTPPHYNRRQNSQYSGYDSRRNRMDQVENYRSSANGNFADADGHGGRFEQSRRESSANSKFSDSMDRQAARPIGQLQPNQSRNDFGTIRTNQQRPLELNSRETGAKFRLH